MAQTQDALTAAGLGNVGLQHFNVTYAGDANYIVSTNSTIDANVPDFTVSKHHTKVDLISVDDVDMTDNSPSATISAPFNFIINATAKITDLNATQTAIDTGDVSGLTFTYSNTAGSTAINTTAATVDFTTEGPSPQRIMARFGNASLLV